MGVELEGLADLFTQSSEAATRQSSGAAKEYFLAEAAFASMSSASGGTAAGWVVSDLDHVSGTLVLEVDVPRQWRGKVRPTVRRLSDFTIQDGVLTSFTVDGRPLREYVCPLAGDGATGWLLARTVVEVPVALVTSTGLMLDGSRPARGRRLDISARFESESRVVEMLGWGWSLGRGWCAELLLPRGETMPITEFRAVRLEGTPAGTVLMAPTWDPGENAGDEAPEFEVSTAADTIVIAPEVSAAVQRRLPDATIEEVLTVEMAATELLQAGRTVEGAGPDVRSAVDLAIELLRLGDSSGA